MVGVKMGITKQEIKSPSRKLKAKWRLLPPRLPETNNWKEFLRILWDWTSPKEMEEAGFPNDMLGYCYYEMQKEFPGPYSIRIVDRVSSTGIEYTDPELVFNDPKEELMWKLKWS